MRKETGDILLLDTIVLCLMMIFLMGNSILGEINIAKIAITVLIFALLISGYLIFAVAYWKKARAESYIAIFLLLVLGLVIGIKNYFEGNVYYLAAQASFLVVFATNIALYLSECIERLSSKIAILNFVVMSVIVFVILYYLPGYL